MSDGMDRRGFLKRAAAISAAAAAAAGGLASGEEGPGGGGGPASGGTPRATMPRRPYGRAGASLSVVGLGGMLVNGMPQAEADAAVAKAVERGITYFDVAPTYGDAEFRLGPALAPFRDGCFLACKTTCRDAAGARAEFERSLSRLRTDHVDLYQLHGIKDVGKDVDPAFAPGGAMEVLIEAKREGRARHLGFSAHTEEAALAALDRFEFDSLMFPVSFPTWYAGRIGPRVIEAAAARGVTVIALKALALQAWPKDATERKRYAKCWYQPVTDPDLAELALRFALDRPIAAVLPPGEPELFWRAVDLAAGYRPLEAGDEARLKTLAAGLAPVFRAP